MTGPLSGRTTVEPAVPGQVAADGVAASALPGSALAGGASATVKTPVTASTNAVTDAMRRLCPVANFGFARVTIRPSRKVSATDGWPGRSRRSGTAQRKAIRMSGELRYPRMGGKHPPQHDPVQIRADTSTRPVDQGITSQIFLEGG